MVTAEQKMVPKNLGKSLGLPKGYLSSKEIGSLNI